MKKPSGSMVHGLQASKSAKDDALVDLTHFNADAAAQAKVSLSKLPSIDRLVTSSALKSVIDQFGITLVTQSCKECIADIRQQLISRNTTGKDAESQGIPGELKLAELIEQTCLKKTTLQFKSVFNMTGTVIHTNLGRSVLADDAIAALVGAAKYPLNLEYDLEEGERGDRDDFVEGLICEITGAEAATFVNNNAAAVLLSIAALAYDREVLISRGELVEIGGSFRMPDVMQSAGARMVEVGTTNRTHLSDYEKALSQHTAILMKIHTSNYQVQGFTKTVSEAELAPLSKKHGIPLVTDLGSGSLIEMQKYGLPHEPTPQEMLKAGCNVVTFSGDKLLGGPQAGIIAGSKQEIELIRRYPMKRALRLSKLPMVALEATLNLYLHPEALVHQLPTLRWLSRPQAEIKLTATTLLSAFTKSLTPLYSVEVLPMMSQIGSGSLPVDTLPSYGLVIKPIVSGNKGIGTALLRLSSVLRALPIPIIGRVERDKLHLDCRCIDDYLRLARQIADLKLG